MSDPEFFINDKSPTDDHQWLDVVKDALVNAIEELTPGGRVSIKFTVGVVTGSVGQYDVDAYNLDLTKSPDGTQITIGDDIYLVGTVVNEVLSAAATATVLAMAAAAMGITAGSLPGLALMLGTGYVFSQFVVPITSEAMLALDGQDSVRLIGGGGKVIAGNIYREGIPGDGIDAVRELIAKATNPLYEIDIVGKTVALKTDVWPALNYKVASSEVFTDLAQHLGKSLQSFLGESSGNHTNNDFYVPGSDGEHYVIYARALSVLDQHLAIRTTINGEEKLINVDTVYENGAFKWGDNLNGIGTSLEYGNGVLRGVTTDNVIIGGSGSDRISIDDNFLAYGESTIVAGGGDDVIIGGYASDIIDAGEGNDKIQGSSVSFNHGGPYGDIGADTIYAGTGDDTVHGSAGADEIHGGGGIDEINYSELEQDATIDIFNNVAQIKGDTQKITEFENVVGGKGNDTIIGNDLENFLTGGGGNDRIVGNDGNDRIYGGEGKDTLLGGEGADTLTGGSDGDQFEFSKGGGMDTILDAEASDRIAFDGRVITGEADNLDNGLYKLHQYALTRSGSDLTVQVNSDLHAGFIIRDFFPPGYDGTKDYTKMGITIPGSDDDPSHIGFRPWLNKVSPIVLDLNGDGLKGIAMSQKSIHFDMDNDGFAERTEWISGNDGFLVRDLNSNGRIDSQSEMFGDNGNSSAYAKLAKLDTNHNGKIDTGDTGFSNLRIWQDSNSNGVTDAGELKTLSSFNIASLSLQETDDTELGNLDIAGTSSFTRTDGTTGRVADVLFDVNQIDSIYVGTDTSQPPEIDLSTIFLPILRGYGSLPSLFYSMTENAELKALVTEFANLDIGTQFHEVYDRINEIILEWAGATDIAPTGQLNDMNAQKIAVLTKIMGGSFDISTTFIDNPYGQFFNSMAVPLLLQGPLSKVFTEASYDYTSDSYSLSPRAEGDGSNLPQIVAEIMQNAIANAPTNLTDNTFYWNAISSIIQQAHDWGSWTSQSPFGDTLKDIVDEAAGFTTTYAAHYTALDNQAFIYGTAGDDILKAGLASKVQAGHGDDYINGGWGDHYIYDKGDGNDTINGGESIATEGEYSRIYFGRGITADSLKFSLVNGDARISILGGGSITLNDSRLSMDDFIRWYTFADGTIKQVDEINYDVFKGQGTAKADVLYGSGGIDTMRGLGGNDTIGGSAGKDHIDAGKGIDTIHYGFSESGVTVNLGLTTAQSGGDAEGDTLVGFENVIGSEYDDLFIGTSGANRFEGNGGDDAVSYITSSKAVNVNLQNGQASGGDADGDKLSNIANIIGSKYNDTLVGSYNPGYVDGGAGNDILQTGNSIGTLIGGAGADTFITTLKGSYGCTIADFSLTTYGEKIVLKNTPVDVSKFTTSIVGDNTIVEFEGGRRMILQDFTDGKFLSAVSFGKSPASLIQGTAAANTLSGTASANSMRGLAGNDVLSGLGGNDILFGDNGSDRLLGGASNDILVGGAGNDTLLGDSGDDLLAGDAGADNIDGGTGNNTATYASSSSAVNIDLRLVTGQSGGDAIGDILVNVQNISGSAFNDTLAGNAHANILSGGAGIDTASYKRSATAVTVDLSLDTSQIGGDAAGDRLYGIENLQGSAFNDTLIGDAGNNLLNGGAGHDSLVGSEGADILIGGTGNDSLDGGFGNDTFAVGQNEGNDTIWGGEDNDTLAFGSGISLATLKVSHTADGVSFTLPGGGTIMLPNLDVENFTFVDGTKCAFSDIVHLSESATSGDDTILGFNEYDDTINGGGGDDTIEGWNGDDSLLGDTGNDTLIGQEGNDVLTGGDGDDLMDGGWDDDTFTVGLGEGNDTIWGGSENDTLTFGNGISWSGLTFQHSDTVTLVINLPGGGSVSIPELDVEHLVFTDGTVKSLEDAIQATLKSTTGNDTLYGYHWRNDVIDGGNGNDVIDALEGDDLIIGGAGNDTIESGWGDDTIYGGAGADKLYGGWDGRDRFVFKAISESSGPTFDAIFDFNDGLDQIDLRGLGFTSVGSGAAAGAKLGYSYNASTDMTMLTSADGLKVQIAGQVVLDAGDFIFA